MYEQNERWKSYYQELVPERRKGILEELLKTEPDDGANAFRLQLYQARYTDPSRPGREVDLFLWQCVNLAFIYETSGHFKSRGKKKLAEAAEELLIPEMEKYGEAGEAAFYWEIRNTVRRYFSTCQDPGYHRKLFGLMKSPEDEQKEQMLKETWEMSLGVSKLLGEEETLRVWNPAVRDEYEALDPGAARRFERYDAAHSK